MWWRCVPLTLAMSPRCCASTTSLKWTKGDEDEDGAGAGVIGVDDEGVGPIKGPKP